MSEDYGPVRGAMSGQELRTRVAIGDLGERDLDEILSTVSRVLAVWRRPGVAGAEHRVLVRRTWPELGHKLDALSGPRT
ncbi:MAG TPA: hypothetical protein VK735_18855 [Pseudonocardia sp.]|uniref:hypothetical protein n=1 Tax=Pseudonocardia sp. TaxID=60912 RepID=UPI002CBBDFD5|nr:hypothetical protein [Pseudonocardia sp.]HTF49508.1 hypothetical protein [Pseudonocardia sp.]